MKTRSRASFYYALAALLVLIAVCLGCAWTLVKWKDERALARATMRFWTPAQERASGMPREVRAPWVLRLLGEEPVSTVVVPKKGPFNARQLRRLFPEAAITYEGNPKDFEARNDNWSSRRTSKATSCTPSC